MIRLVTQFDEVETRASAATPTCGCCCCCCCCLATVVATSAFTTMHLRVHTRKQEEATGRSPSPAPEIVGALALLMVLLLGSGVASNSLGGRLFAAAVVWFLILLGLYHWVGSERAWVPAIGTVLIGSALLAGEFIVGLALIVASAGAYFALAVPVAIVAIVIEYRSLLGRQ